MIVFSKWRDSLIYVNVGNGGMSIEVMLNTKILDRLHIINVSKLFQNEKSHSIEWLFLIY